MEEKKSPSPSIADVSPKHKPISLLFHIITISITCAIALLSIKITVEQPTPVEEEFSIKSLIPSMINTNNAPIPIKTGLSIYNYRIFDMLNATYEFEGTIWFEFDPSTISIDTVSEFEFEKGDIIHKSSPRSRLNKNRLLVFYDILVRFKTELNYKLFPVDDHIIKLILVNKKVTPQELMYEIHNQSFIVRPKTESFGWIEKLKEVLTGYVEEVIDTRNESYNIYHPAVQFSILYRRSGLKYALILLMPMVVFIIVMLTSFSYDPYKYFSSIMVANGASLSGLIAFRFVIENMSPEVGYFMISDYFFLIFLVLAALLFLIGIFSMNVSMKAKKTLILLVHGLLISSFIIIVSYILSFTYHGTHFF